MGKLTDRRKNADTRMDFLLKNEERMRIGFECKDKKEDFEYKDKKEDHLYPEGRRGEIDEIVSTTCSRNGR